jgi:hypothetical protein
MVLARRPKECCTVLTVQEVVVTQQPKRRDFFRVVAAQRLGEGKSGSQTETRPGVGEGDGGGSERYLKGNLVAGRPRHHQP